MYHHKCYYHEKVNLTHCSDVLILDIFHSPAILYHKITYISRDSEEPNFFVAAKVLDSQRSVCKLNFLEADWAFIPVKQE